VLLPSRYLEEFLKEQYEAEQKRCDSINQSLSFPLGVVILLFGFVAYYGKILCSCGWGPGSIVLAVLGAVLLMALVLASALLTLSFYGYGYGYIPTATEIIGYAEKIAQYYDSLPAPTRAALVEDRVRRLLIKEYSEHADRNARNNDKKSKYRHWAATCLVAALVTVLLSLPALCFVSVYESRDLVQKVKVTNLSGREAKMTDSTNDQDQQPEVPAPQPDEPKPPSGRVIKESRDTPEESPVPPAPDSQNT